MMKNILFIILYSGVLSVVSRAQDPLAQETSDSTDSEGHQRIHYTLILPEEKNPEVLKTDENNPFEVVTDEDDKGADTEENRVRDILVSMRAVGGGAGPTGTRVMLGGMRLEVGKEVPEVIPDQQVILKVKSISEAFVELVWVEKTPTGLPPKPFVIPIDVSPSVRYLMPSSGSGNGAGSTGTLRHGDLAEARRKAVAESGIETVQNTVKAVPVDDQPTKTSSAPSPASNVPEASVMKMLFGNHGPQTK